MRVVSEYLGKTDQLLIRLLGTTTPVQTGAYTVDGTPEFPEPFLINVSTDSIVNNEVRVVFSGFNLTPTDLVVTLPDSSTAAVKTVLVETWTPSGVLPQNAETLIPDAPPIHQPIPTKAEVIAAPVYPSKWCELDLTQTNPLKLGAMCQGTMAYVGGCAGRALDGMSAQPSADSAPYLIPAPLHLEGDFTNVLENELFLNSRTVVGFLDPVPELWDIQLSDPSSMMRIEPQMIGLLPTLLLTYYKAPGTMTSAAPPVTIITPNVPNSYEFRALFDPGSKNAPGKIVLSSQDGFVSAPAVSLNGTTSVGLNVGSHGGRVKIVWDQQYGDGEAQTLRIACPTANQYIGPRTWTPRTEQKFADQLTATLSFPTFKLDSGSLRVDSVTESALTPISWVVSSDATSQNLFSVTAGMLSSAFSSYAPISLSSYLSSLQDHGRYTLQWRPGQDLRLLGKGITSPGLALPFRLDLPIPTAVSTGQLRLTFTSYKSDEGSGRLQYFAFSPT